MFDALRDRMKQNAKRIAIVSNGQEYTYQQLSDEVDRKEKMFRSHNIGTGDVVALIGDFSFGSIASLLALFFCKSTAAPLTREANQKLKKYIDMLKPDFLYDTYADNEVTSLRSQNTGTIDVWRRVLPMSSGGLVVFTSGSTGVPKAIFHDIDSLCYRYIDAKEPITSICFLLFDHMGGINTLLFLLFRGGTAINVSDRQVDIVCHEVQKYKVELLPTTPSFLSQLLMTRAYQTYDLSSLTVISYGSEVMSEVVLKKLNEVLPHCAFKQTYGLSETGVLQIKSKSNDTLWFKFIDKGVETNIVDNVLWIKTKSNLLGKVIFQKDVLVLEESSGDWFCTNDLVDVDGDFIKILGRRTDIINIGGLKVYPGEVENCIQELVFVDDAFVKAKKHPMLGQIAVAYILLNDKIRAHDAEKQIRQHCIAKLEKFKVPSQFIFSWENFINDRFKKVRTP